MSLAIVEQENGTILQGFRMLLNALYRNARQFRWKLAGIRFNK